MIWTPLQKLPNNVGNLIKQLLPPALKSCPKVQKSSNLVTLNGTYSPCQHIIFFGVKLNDCFVVAAY